MAFTEEQISLILIVKQKYIQYGRKQKKQAVGSLLVC